ncbi:hypothetical protein ACLQ2R_33430 [Streptosporangium sp. DT93]|uniref:hypothetical protein n=1 Tax=Streptosporangium sp. DT93 TaxID=3393428 RepID=UPI003CE7A7DE
MSQQINSTLIWSRAAEMNAAGGANYTELVSLLARKQPDESIELGKLSGETVLKLQHLLGLTAEELLPGIDTVAAKPLLRERKDGRSLHVALTHFGPLSNEEIISVFDWSMERLETAFRVLEELLTETGRQVQRSGAVLSLREEKYALSKAVTDALRARRDWSLPVLAQEACLLVTALRPLPPHTHGAVELPACTITELIQRGIAAPYGRATSKNDDRGVAHTSRRESLPFVLHPDVMFAFSPGEPSMPDEVMDTCADHHSAPS